MTPAEFTSLWGPWLVACAGAVAACYERFMKRKRNEAALVSEAKDELVKVQTEQCAAWKGRFESTHEELQAYREETRRKADEANCTILQLTDENARLKMSTDMTPVIHHQEEQNQINAKILTFLDEAIDHLRALRAIPAKTKAKRKTP
jgi:hypothetical protein